jgi:hypothetical protein
MTALELVAARLADPRNAWSLGGSGALAEFMRAANEPCERDALQAVTARGAIRVEARGDLAALAYEILSAQPGLWHHGVLFSLPAAAAVLPARTVVTELGLDREAIRAEDRAAVLFDLGLGSAAFAFCVRTADAALLAALRREAGSGFLAAGPALGAALVVASPHRVVISRAARIEVYQPIAAAGGVTPDGPHTHLIPRLLRPGRPVSSNIPLAPGRVPGFTLHPPHPAKDESGERKPFVAVEHADFQRLLERFGDPASVAAKAALRAAVERRDAPETWRAPATRHARLACRIALRQLCGSGRMLGALRDWETALDRNETGRRKAGPSSEGRGCD